MVKWLELLACSKKVLGLIGDVEFAYFRDMNAELIGLFPDLKLPIEVSV